MKKTIEISIVIGVILFTLCSFALAAGNMDTKTYPKNNKLILTTQEDLYLLPDFDDMLASSKIKTEEDTTNPTVKDTEDTQNKKEDKTEDKNKDKNEKKDTAIYPVYNGLSKKEQNVYTKIYETTKSFKTTTGTVYEVTSEAAADKWIDGFVNTYRDIIYERSELFWVDPYNFKTRTTQVAANKYTIEIMPVYLFNKADATKMKSKFDTKVNSIVTTAKTKGSTYEKVLYVHDTLLELCNYDDETVEKQDYTTSAINAYGCLIDGEAVCSGYTMAFTLIMRNLGYECGAEFNNYNEAKLTDEGHVWNYCKLDGDYYYFDLTWDDIKPDESSYKFIHYTHCYFGMTAEEILKTKSHRYPKTPATTPDCNGTKYNYFTYNKQNFSTYDFEAVKKSISAQSKGKCIALRFDNTADTDKAVKDLITNGKLFTIVSGYSSCEYTISATKHHLYIFMKK